MYGMLKFVVLFSLVAIAIQSFSSFQGQRPTNPEENAILRQDVVALQSALKLQRITTKISACSHEATEELVEENAELHREVVSLKDALKRAELDILEGRNPDRVRPLVDKIQRQVETMQESWKSINGWGQGTSSTPLSRQFVAQHSELVQRLQILGGALPIIHTRLVHEEMSLLHLQTVMQISLRELQSLIVETANVLGGKYEPATLVDFQLSSETIEMQKVDAGSLV